MTSENQQDPKKGFPSSFLFFLFAAVMLVTLVTGFVDKRFANVAFSYQLEHLVNLKLITPEDSKKTALNDNLVTFSGHFRQALPEDSKTRFKYLTLLHDKHDLDRKKMELSEDMATQRLRIQEAADWFLHLSGTPIPLDGFVVVDQRFDTPDQINSIVVSSLSNKKLDSIEALKSDFSEQLGNSSSMSAFGKRLHSFIRSTRSPQLGIGDQKIKDQLLSLEKSLSDVKEKSAAEQQRVYQKTLSSLDSIFATLLRPQDGVLLTKLRSVRSYREGLEEYQLQLIDLDDVDVRLDKARESVTDVIWFFNGQEVSTRSLEKQDVELYNQWYVNARQEWENFAGNKGAIFRAPDQPLNTVLEKTFKSEQPSTNYFGFLFNFLPILLVLGVVYYLFSRQMKGMGNNAMNFGKSPAKLMEQGENKVTFKDVAGADEALEELQEIVDFLKDPQRFTTLGGRIPKGVLCVGPPGTGKTLIARAVAGEADRPFFSISGSDFVEMFVGVGASRIRDMFNQAKKNAPCIIFMDEIDAVGRHRGAGIGGGHDEREQTLNQLLVEMDGFDSNDGVILVAATNRPDVLDKALLRPGRFDRRVVLGLPDIKGRYEILKVHAKKVKLDENVDLDALAKSTPGASGADLENILNEAALLAARKKRTAVTNAEVVEARDKVLYGKERRSMELDEQDKLTTAYHESGHAVVGYLCHHSDPVDKVTIIPRGMSLGSTMFLPKKNRTSYWKQELLHQLQVLMGGRVAEQLFVNDISSGAQQDISQATKLARSMVCQWGMSDKLGPVAYAEQSSETQQYLGMGGSSEKQYAEQTAQVIDAEVSRLLDQAEEGAKELLEEHREAVELMTQMLMEFETLDAHDVDLIMTGKWDEEEKRARLQEAEERNRVEKAEPPPVPDQTDTDSAENSFSSMKPDPI